eukprot:TRINITY_DN17165_c0_g1_i1.p1 TRINITY_DN17165_c0_g1~~TRINITY_DN17165_c0_g1_i1.p1  ORF type:complete len:215 (+),score=34.18 TRINITY_DN17165_c0_g1_i1:233-877(+)
MTLQDYGLMSSIPKMEFYKLNFTSANLSPNLSFIAKRFNNLTCWVTSSITTGTGVKSQLKMLTHFIHIAKKLEKLDNDHGFMTVMLGLTQHTVCKMKGLWKSLLPKDQDRWERLRRIASPSNNFRQLRLKSSPTSSSGSGQNISLHNHIQTPIVFLRDITQLEEGNDDYVDKEKTQINFFKLIMLGDIIRNIHGLPYHMQPKPVIQQFLCHLNQ